MITSNEPERDRENETLTVRHGLKMKTFDDKMQMKTFTFHRSM
jgi:hypothetical protein